MTLITAVAFLLAVRMDAMAVAILGMAGGFLTPVLLSTGQDNPLGLFGYIALLDIGLLTVARRKEWRALSDSRGDRHGAHADRVGRAFFPARKIFRRNTHFCSDGRLPRFRNSLLRGILFDQARIEIGRCVQDRGDRDGHRRVGLGRLFPVLPDSREPAAGIAELRLPRRHHPAGDGFPERETWRARRESTGVAAVRVSRGSGPGGISRPRISTLRSRSIFFSRCCIRRSTGPAASSQDRHARGGIIFSRRWR